MNKGHMDCGVSEEFFLTFEVNLAHLFFSLTILPPFLAHLYTTATM